MESTLRGQCPTYRAINWSRDGVTIAVDVNGEVHRFGTAPIGGPSDPEPAAWTCERCGYRAAEGGDLEIELSVLAIANPAPRGETRG